MAQHSIHQAHQRKFHSDSNLCSCEINHHHHQDTLLHRWTHNHYLNPLTAIWLRWRKSVHMMNLQRQCLSTLIHCLHARFQFLRSLLLTTCNGNKNLRSNWSLKINNCKISCGKWQNWRETIMKASSNLRMLVPVGSNRSDFPVFCIIYATVNDYDRNI